MLPSTASHSTAWFIYDGHGIVTIILKDDRELTVQDVIDHRAIASQLVNGKPHCVLAIPGKHTQATDDARQFAAENRAAQRIAEAVVIRSLSVRLMANFYLKFQKPFTPTRIFTTQDEAMKWLQSLLPL